MPRPVPSAAVHRSAKAVRQWMSWSEFQGSTDPTNSYILIWTDMWIHKEYISFGKKNRYIVYLYIYITIYIYAYKFSSIKHIQQSMIQTSHNSAKLQPHLGGQRLRTVQPAKWLDLPVPWRHLWAGHTVCWSCDNRGCDSSGWWSIMS